MTKEEFYKIVRPYTMTSEERIYDLFDTLEYIRTNNIEGDWVECGVWLGGNILGMCEYAHRHNMNRRVWLYDTFQGMTPPEDVDVDYENNKAKDILKQVMCEGPLEEVKKVLSQTQYPKDRMNIIIGDVLETLNDSKNLPEQISLLRLDTDWYQSTKKELQVLYPKLISNGVLIVDDFGHWRGSRMAVEEYFDNKLQYKFIDYTGIKHIK
jgi:O-methyltransferase